MNFMIQLQLQIQLMFTMLVGSCCPLLITDNGLTHLCVNQGYITTLSINFIQRDYFGFAFERSASCHFCTLIKLRTPYTVYSLRGETDET